MTAELGLLLCSSLDKVFELLKKIGGSGSVGPFSCDPGVGAQSTIACEPLPVNPANTNRSSSSVRSRLQLVALGCTTKVCSLRVGRAKRF